jgi:hypothetical protein
MKANVARMLRLERKNRRLARLDRGNRPRRPLPRIKMETDSVWPRHGCWDDILNRVVYYVERTEVAHA